MVYDINPFVFREKYLLPMIKKHRKYFERKTIRNIELTFFTHINGKFGLTPPISHSKEGRLTRPYRQNLSIYIKTRKVPFWRIALQSDSEFATLWQIAQKISDHSRGEPVRGRSSKKHELDQIFFKNLIIRFKAKDHISISASDTGWICNFDDTTVPFDDEMLKSFKTTRMFEFLGEEAIFLKDFINSEKMHYDNVSLSMDEII